MSFSRTITNIANLWPTYLQKTKVDKTDPAYQEVVTTFPTLLETTNPNIKTLLFKGSSGATNITFAPWVAVFDDRETLSAQEGFYIVYLFSTDLNKLYLTISLGTTQFQNFYNSKKDTFSGMRDVASILTSFNTNNNNFNPYKQGVINLLAKKNTTHEYYEKSTIYYKEYDTGNLPSEQILIDDYLNILDRYQDMINNPSLPSVSSLFHAQVKNVLPTSTPTVSTFIPRPKKISTTGKGKGGNTSGGSRYKNAAAAKLIGDKGELIVLEYEKNKLINAGLTSLSKSIIHEEAIGNRPGWDITSYDINGNQIYIEVKSSSSAKQFSFEFTANEHRAATDSNYSSNYYIYLVTNVDTKKAPGIETLKNPILQEKNNKIDIKPIRYQVDL